MVTVRQALVADIASVEGDIGRTRNGFAAGGDLMRAATELESEAERLLLVASNMGEISRKALKKVLDGGE